MSINELINQSEGRRLEFKGELPTNSDLAKTVVAFANDAGGEIYIGINDNPRQIIGLSEEELPRIEEQISNLIYDRCYPIILPEVSFLTIEDKHLIKVCIYRGSMPPYYLKDKGKLKGTYIRVGSTNKLADETIIAELERRRRNISFDSEVVMDKSADELDISGLKLLYKEKTGEFKYFVNWNWLRLNRIKNILQKLYFYFRMIICVILCFRMPKLNVPVSKG